MSDAEYDEELPSIVVYSAARKPGLLSMPTAGELAQQRARELQCEQELAELHKSHVQELQRPRAGDSSGSDGSEGEASLAAAVGSLAVEAPTQSEPPAKRAAALLRALAATLRHGHAAQLALTHAALMASDDDVVAVVLDPVVSSTQAALLRGPRWPEEDEGVGAGLVAWLSALALRPPAARVRRLLQHALDCCAARAHAHEAQAALLAAGDARALLDVAAAARSSAGKLGDEFADGLVRGAAQQLLGAPSPLLRDLCDALRSGAGRSLSAAQRHTLVRLLAAALHYDAHAAELRATLLSSLTTLHSGDSAALAPDRLNMVVAISKLRLLLRE